MIMTFELDCDSCGYQENTDSENSAYATAREHEAEHPSHIVQILEE